MCDMLLSTGGVLGATNSQQAHIDTIPEEDSQAPPGHGHMLVGEVPRFYSQVKLANNYFDFLQCYWLLLSQSTLCKLINEL